ncbi:MAG: phosphoribosylamine--glycine ligase [Treponemataceae bacterium]|nr:phosphoribosylamine--glycine ligase [Treponemataceae bacterium]
MRIAVIGSGGREHAISWALAKCPEVEQVICIPGNGGTAEEEKCININPANCDYTETLIGNDAIVQVCAYEKVDFAVCGPEDPLAGGIADQLWKVGIPVVGPKSKGAQLEASKDLAKSFMQKYGVACAKSATFTDAKSAHEYVDEQGAPIVIKADGLAAGKGVVVALNIEDAHAAITEFMENGKLGEAGNKLVIEEYLSGVEISILAAVSVTEETAANGKATIVPFVTARDHKRLMDGAKGPNTGGMGAIAPVADVTEKQLDAFQKTILEPTLKGLIEEKMDYRGFIFFGIMLTKSGPKLLEYNVRLGDPETQAVLPLMDFDFAAMCQAIIDGSLKDFSFKWKKGFACAPVAVSGGYPASYKKGYKISMDKNVINGLGTKVFIAGGNVDENGILVTSGGRVLAASSVGETFEQAWENSYKALEAINFTDMFYRKDIGLPGAAESL